MDENTKAILRECTIGVVDYCAGFAIRNGIDFNALIGFIANALLEGSKPKEGEENDKAE